MSFIDVCQVFGELICFLWFTDQASRKAKTFKTVQVEQEAYQVSPERDRLHVRRGSILLRGPRKDIEHGSAHIPNPFLQCFISDKLIGDSNHN